MVRLGVIAGLRSREWMQGGRKSRRADQGHRHHKVPSYPIPLGGLVPLAMLTVVLAAGCLSGGPPETAGNRVISFGLEFDQGGQLSVAYRQLCSEVRRKVSLQEFKESRGLAVSPVLASDSWILTRNDEIPSAETLDDSVTEASIEMDVRWPPEARLPPSTTSEPTWRVRLQREEGVWTVCGFEPS